MKYTELPKNHQKTALQWAVDGWNQLYHEQGLKVKATENSPEVMQILEDEEYEIEYGCYEKGMPYKRLVRI